MKKYIFAFIAIISMVFLMDIAVSATNVEASENAGWYYDESTSTLTLTNYTSNDVISVGTETCQIYSDGDLNIVLEGTNLLNLESTYGIYAEGHLTISGNGTLNISNTQQDIYVRKNITVKSGNVVAKSIQSFGGSIVFENGHADLTEGMKAENGKITINNGEISAEYISANQIDVINGTINANFNKAEYAYIKGGIVNFNGGDTHFVNRLTISGGKVTSYEGLKTNYWLSIEGGEVILNTSRSGTYALKGGNSFIVEGGSINLYGDVSGSICMTGGTMYIDGNVSGVGHDISGGSLTINGCLKSYIHSIFIDGGTINIESDTYGLDAVECGIRIDGGNVSVLGQMQAMRYDIGLYLYGNCISYLTGSSASNAKEETQYYGEKYFETKENHSWNAGSITTNPTHLTEGTYTYTCNNCSNKKHEAIPKITTHEFGNWIYADATNHKRECLCGEIETESHSWSVATCTTKSKCAACNSEYGELDTNNHLAATVWMSANGQHYHACTNGCDAKLDVSICVDTDTNHKCDICSSVMGTHEAVSGKHTCDYCNQIVTECEDKDKNHKCDVCSAAMGTHEAASGKHTCDYCKQTVTECEDGDKDHKCDICSSVMGTHEAVSGKHTCDYCNQIVTECEDKDKNHKCDVCSAAMSTHEAASGKHTCDYCKQTVTECEDKDKNHKCDVCSATMGTHEAAGGKHTCDYCDQIVTECKDNDNDYTCDICGAIVSVGTVGDSDNVSNSDGNGLSGDTIAGIVIGSSAVIGVGGFSLVWFVIKKKSWADLLAIFKK